MQDLDDMEIPVKNKESLDSKDIISISRFKYKIAIWTAVFSFLGLLVTNSIPVIENVLTSKEKALMRKANEQQAVKAIVDSLNDRAAKEMISQSFKDINEIYSQLELMRRQLPTSASISIYSTHDSGGVPQSGSPLHISILYQSHNIEPTLTKEYWQKRMVPKGYFHLAKNLYDRGEFYIENVENYPDIYVGDSREDLDLSNIKSVFGCLVKVAPKAVYYLTVSFQETDPHINAPNMKILTRLYAKRFEKLLRSNYNI